MQARQAVSADATTVGATLRQAFDDDPVWRWIAGDRAGRLVEAITAAGCSWHPAQFTISDGAVAWWRQPDQWRLGLPETLRLVPHVLPVARGATLRLLRLATALERQHPREPAAYLEFLGASVQGQGRGALVVQPALDVCDAFGWPAFLESSNPRNRPFYRRLGFVDRPALRLPGGCPPIIPMWREPR